MRLDKFLGTAFTRSEARKLIKSGAVTVNGVTAVKADFKVDENSDTVICGGEQIVYREFIYLVMNKPAGFVSAVWDKKQRCVTELLRDEHRRFEPFPVGRLDIDTEGLLILTNDGALTHELISPKKNVVKKYFAVTDLPMEDADAELFASGMDLGDFTALPAKLEFTENKNEIYISVSEGKFHQVKRMCEKCGKKVTYLKRVSIGGLHLDSALKCGEYAELTKENLTSQIYSV